MTLTAGAATEALMLIVPVAAHGPRIPALTLALNVWPGVSVFVPLGTETLPKMQPRPEPVQPVLVTVTDWLDVKGFVQLSVDVLPAAAVIVSLPALGPMLSPLASLQVLLLKVVMGDPPLPR